MPRGAHSRDVELEKQVLEEAHKIGLGAQFGGKYLARYCVSSVAASRCVLSGRSGRDLARPTVISNVKLTRTVSGLKKLDSNPGELIPGRVASGRRGRCGTCGFEPSDERDSGTVGSVSGGYPLSLNGTIIVGRDIAHAKLKASDRGEDLPQYIKDHPIYYAGPAKTPSGMAYGSMGDYGQPLDPYVDLFQSHGGSMIMLAKGNRSQVVMPARSTAASTSFYRWSGGHPCAEQHQEHRVRGIP